MSTAKASHDTFFSNTQKKKIYLQKYGSNPQIEGVQLFPLHNMLGDEGDFCEILRIDEEGSLEAVPGFKVRQINRTRLFGRSVKAWHMHKKQDEIWYISPHSQLFVGLWDMRTGSKTEGQAMRLNIGGGSSRMLYIPRGVAHGSANFDTKPIELFYVVNQQFNISEPDEYRLPWDAKGEEFWTPERD